MWRVDGGWGGAAGLVEGGGDGDVGCGNGDGGAGDRGCGGWLGGRGGGRGGAGLALSRAAWVVGSQSSMSKADSTVCTMKRYGHVKTLRTREAIENSAEPVESFVESTFADVEGGLDRLGHGAGPREREREGGGRGRGGRRER